MNNCFHFTEERKCYSVGWLLSVWSVVLVLTACGGTQSSKDTPLSETPLNGAPVFTSAIDISVQEQTVIAAIVHANDTEGDIITYSIAGGIDDDKFFIDSHTGELRFKQAPDFEAPTDNNANNSYIVVIAASDGIGETLQTITVSVTDAALSVDVLAGHIKTLTFTWPAVIGATHYKLYINPNGISGYTQVGDDITDTQTEVTIPVHLTDWFNRLYMLEGYDGDELLYSSDPVDITTLMLDTIGYIKASNTEAFDWFGNSVTLSADGNTLAVGATGEDSATTGIDGDQDDDTAEDAGAVYVFTRLGGVWTQQAYIKASNIEADDQFGTSVALSADGNTLAVGALGEDSAGIGVGGDQDDNAADDTGAVYVFTRLGGTWTQQAYIKASNAEAADGFGDSATLSADGNTLAVGANGEDSATTGVDGDQDDNTAANAGAVYVFVRVDGAWTQQAYVKASNAEEEDGFGDSVTLSADGNTLVAGALGEASAATGINGDQSDNAADDAGAVYVFTRQGEAWAQQAYIKASNTDVGDSFGDSVTLSADGNTLAVGTPVEESAAIGIDGDQGDNTAPTAGAVYVFTREDVAWTQQAYIKASNTDVGDWFGESVTLSADGHTLAVGAVWEDSATVGVNGDQGNDVVGGVGAVYMFIRNNGTWAQAAYIKAPNGENFDRFGENIALSADGSTLAAGAFWEESAATGVNGAQHDNTAISAGAVYLY